jgi:hypothetical protein
MIEDNTHVVKGLPPLGPIPDVSVGKLIYDKLLTHCVEDEAMVSFIMFSDQLYSLTLTHDHLIVK